MLISRTCATVASLALVIVPALAQDLKIGVASEVTSIDPHFHNLGPNNALRRHIFESLVATDAQQKLVPGLAASWRPLDERSWEFKLRSGVTFSNGRELSARDVIYTLCRVPTVENSPSSFAVFTRGIEAIETPEPGTMVFRMAQPTPLLPNSFSTIGICRPRPMAAARSPTIPKAARNSARCRNRSSSTIPPARSGPDPTGSPTTRAAPASFSSATRLTGATSLIGGP
jgi:ABC-type transport system substrate-binding protein